MAMKPTEGEIRKTIESGKSKAGEYAKDPEKARKLLDDAAKKAESFGNAKGPIKQLIDNIQTLYRMLLAYFKKEYKEIPWESLVLAIVAVVYFVSPIDLIPDAIPVLGYIDDALVVAFVIRAIGADLENFKQWEAAQGKNA